VRFSPDGRVRLAGARLSSKAVIGPSPLPPPASPPERITAAAGSIARIQPLRDDAFKAKLARMAKHHVARLQVNDHIAEAVSGRSKDWIKMKNPAAREMVVKKAEKTRTHFIFRTEHLAALGTFCLA
jgi:hypothetical protein